MKPAILSLFLALLICACSDCDTPDAQHQPDPSTSDHKMRLTIRIDPALVDAETSQIANTLIDNIQVLLFDKDSICLKVIPIEPVSFDENNTTAVTFTAPVTTTRIMVLANGIGYTSVVQRDFIGLTPGEIYMITRNNAPNTPTTYFKEPIQLFDGSSDVAIVNPDETVEVSVTISRVISKIVVQLDKSMQFDPSIGKSILAINTPVTIQITNIDSIFVTDIPVGVNLPVTQYWNNLIGFKQCQIFKASHFTQNSNMNLCDSIYVFPQINASKLPYITLSVTGSKGGTEIGTGNVKSLYYGIRIKDVTDGNRNPVNLNSLPRNSIITLTINNFSGPGFDNIHPDPDLIGTLDVSAVVKSWSGHYESSGDVE